MNGIPHRNDVLEETTSHLFGDTISINVASKGLYYPTYGIKGANLKPNSEYEIDFELRGLNTRDAVVAVFHSDSFIEPQAVRLEKDKKVSLKGTTKDELGEWGIHIMLEKEYSAGNEVFRISTSSNKAFNDYYKNIEELLPYELQAEGNAVNIKKILKIYGGISHSGDKLNYGFGALLDIYNAELSEVDYIGNMYAVTRLIGENDEDYKSRIMSTLIKRKTPTTLPQLQQAIESIVDDGSLYVYENYAGLPANVYLTGTADELSIKRSVDLVRTFLPAGVRAIIPVVSFNTWQAVNDQFETWSSLGDEGFIW